MNSKGSIKSVFFDVGNTLMNFDFQIINNLVATYALYQDFKILAPKLWKQLNYYINKSLEEERAPQVLDFIANFIVDHLILCDKNYMSDQIKQSYHQQSFWCQVNHDAKEVPTELKTQGFHVGVISNGDGKVAELLIKHGWDMFDVIVDSGVVQVEKPNKRIFELALQESKAIRAEESIYVGDLPSIDVIGAISANFIPILYDPYNIFEDECVEIMRKMSTKVYRIQSMQDIFGVIQILNI